MWSSQSLRLQLAELDALALGDLALLILGLRQLLQCLLDDLVRPQRLAVALDEDGARVEVAEQLVELLLRGRRLGNVDGRAFGEEFIRYIRLMYSTENPTTRQLCLNGYLSQPFCIGAGVAQGCPLSPLRFLLITEPLNRMFQNNEHLQGVTVHGIRHLISQYADDTTLVLKPGDEDEARSILGIWETATSMLENSTKREGLLLGGLRKHPEKAPPDMVVNWTPDGDTIRALGVPIGNDFSEHDWWLG
eukprot:1834888-Prymnesium_polylepis.1